MDEIYPLIVTLTGVLSLTERKHLFATRLLKSVKRMSCGNTQTMCYEVAGKDESETPRICLLNQNLWI